MPLAPGTHLGRYEVVELVGVGGMGEVYRARDSQLRRDVAIKVLPAHAAADPDRFRRFEQEAQAAGSLNHPNIVTTYDVGLHGGVPYLVSELLEGRTLRSILESGPLSLHMALELALQVAQGLSAAHARGVVHRDLKPENVFVTVEDRAKILDFGLAKLTHPDTTDASVQLSATMAVTEPGKAWGTVGYMAPEQIRGAFADHRADIFAFGATFYEMLTGIRAFQGASAADTIGAILKDEPPSIERLKPDVPGTVAEIIRRCLAKSPGDRFQSAQMLIAALRHSHTSARTAAVPSIRGSSRRALFGTAAAVVVLLFLVGLLWRTDVARRLHGGRSAARIRSIAVLPLANVSGTPEYDYLADGITESVVNDLGRIPTVRVISRTSTNQYKGTSKPLPDIARELGVDAVVEGSVARAGDRVHVRVRLVDAAADKQLWSGTYDRSVQDLVTVEADVGRALVSQVDVEAASIEKQRSTPYPANPSAYDAYLKAHSLMDQGTEAALHQARDYYQRAIGLDARYAPAHAGLAAYYSILPFYSQFSPAEVFPAARAAAQRALELDDNLPEAHASMAYIRAYYEWDWDGAEREFQRALDLRPSYADAHFSYSRFLAASGKIKEAVREIQRAHELDPLSLSLKANEALLAYFDRRYDAALVELEKLARREPNSAIARWAIGLVYEQQGRPRDAVAQFLQATKLSTSLNMKASLGHGYAVAGDPRQARAIFRELEEQAGKSYVPAYYSAVLHVGLGDRDKAIASLWRAFQERSTLLAYLRVDPRFDPLRGDPRFRELMQRVGRR